MIIFRNELLLFFLVFFACDMFFFLFCIFWELLFCSSYFCCNLFVVKTFSLFNIPGVSYLQVLASKPNLTCQLEFCAMVINNWLTFAMKSSVLYVRGFMDSFLNLYLCFNFNITEGGELLRALIVSNYTQFIVWRNGWKFVYELSGCGFASCCSHSIYTPSYLFSSTIMTIT